MKKCYTVTDLGGGDGGKGGVVDKLCEMNNAHTVLKVGGAQGSHGVRTSTGQNFNFSQFGCGTFRGAKTHVTELMVIEPYYFIDEGLKLKDEFGLSDIFNQISIDENSLCVTPFHAIASQLRELNRGDKPKGTVGLGVGETKRDEEMNPSLAIYAKDLSSYQLKKKLEDVKNLKQAQLAEIINNISSFNEDDNKRAQKLDARMVF